MANWDVSATNVVGAPGAGQIAPTTNSGTFTATGLNQMQFGMAGGAAGQFQGYVERVGLWKTRGLSDAQVQTLSSPAAP